MASASTLYGIGNNYSQFDVFINHRGPDVKKGLASHLYHLLRAHGLRVFLDIEELKTGDNLNPQIEGAIKTASVHIAIFSSGYAESSWCLNELVQMLESGKTILPVFYKVNPSELRWTLTGDGLYARALRMLEEKTTFDSQANKEKPRYDSDTLEKWRNALFGVSHISGFEVNACNCDEGQLVHEVVEQVLKKVSKTPLNVAKYPIGLGDKVKDFETTVLSQQQSGKTTVVGIVGLGGVGKSTLAKDLFNRHRSNYHRSCFLSDVRENAHRNSLNSLQSILLKDLAQLTQQINNADEGIEKLKRHLSSSHSALVVFDDIDHISQLDALFSPVRDTIHSSSLVLVTSRNKALLKSLGIVESFIYKQTGLNRQHSQELFCLHAFNEPYPRIGFEQLVEKFLDACDGLPLSLQVIGALLCGEDLEYWEAQLHKISKILPSDIMRRLKISYDSLEEEEKQIFLDIACFFIGEDRETAIRIWDGSGWQGWLGLRNLENKCLVEVDGENCIRMHDHLRDLGRDISKKETSHRLWCSTDNLLHSLSDQSCVRGISMVHGNGPQQSFEIPTNLRRLQLLRAGGNSVENIYSVAHSPELVWLCWYSCPFSCLPSWISVKNLRVLYIGGEKLETLWEDEFQVPLQLTELYIDADLLNFPKSIGKLKHLEKIVLHWKSELNGYINMKLLPNSLGKCTNLQRIELRYCSALKMLPDSVGNWTNLRYINLTNCWDLQMLPDSVGNWTNLRYINLTNCWDLQMLPDSVGNWTNLRYIDLTGCRDLQMLPDSVGNWTNLQSLCLKGCSDSCMFPTLQMLPDSVGNWTNLRYIDLTGCRDLQMLPDSVGNWTNLQSLCLKGCSNLHMLPDSVGNWTNLPLIDLSWCSSLQMLPDSVGNWMNLQSIDMEECYNLQMLPDSVGNWTNLQSIDMKDCCNLQKLPDSVGNWTSLQDISLKKCSSLEILPDSVGNWTSLKVISLKRCSNLQTLPDSVGNWTNLQGIDLERCFNLKILPDSVGKWTNLQRMGLRNYTLQMLPDSVGNWTNLQLIDLGRCNTLQMLPNSVGNWTSLQHIGLEGCFNLQKLPDSVGNWTKLQSIDLEECSNLQMLPDSVGNWTKLQSMYLKGCSNLQMLPDSVGNWTNLQSIYLKGCSNLQILPESIGNWTNLQSIDFNGRSNLQSIERVLQFTDAPRFNWELDENPTY